MTLMEYNLTLTFIVLGVIVGYASMRRVLQQLVDLTNANRRALEDVLSPDKIKELSKEDNEKYMGVPFRYIPSPVKGYKNFGDYYFTQCTNLFKDFGIEADLESTGEEYEKGIPDLPKKHGIVMNFNEIRNNYHRYYSYYK